MTNTGIGMQFDHFFTNFCPQIRVLRPIGFLKKENQEKCLLWMQGRWRMNVSGIGNETGGGIDNKGLTQLYTMNVAV